MLSLDSGEDMGGVEAAGPFRLSDLALWCSFFFFLIFSFPSLSLDLLLALCGPVWYSPGVLPLSPLPCPFAWLSGAQVNTMIVMCQRGCAVAHKSGVPLGFQVCLSLSLCSCYGPLSLGARGVSVFKLCWFRWYWWEWRGPHSTVYHSECSCLCWINVWFLSLVMLHFSSLLGLWALSMSCMKDTQQNRNTKNTNNFNLEQQQKESALRLNRNILWNKLNSTNVAIIK